MVTSSYSAKKGTHITSYTLLLHEKIAIFMGVGRKAKGRGPLDFHT